VVILLTTAKVGVASVPLGVASVLLVVATVASVLLVVATATALLVVATVLPVAMALLVATAHQLATVGATGVAMVHLEVTVHLEAMVEALRGDTVEVPQGGTVDSLGHKGEVPGECRSKGAMVQVPHLQQQRLQQVLHRLQLLHHGRHATIHRGGRTTITPAHRPLCGKSQQTCRELPTQLHMPDTI